MYYYLTYHDIGIGQYSGYKGAICFDVSEQGSPKSDFGRLLVSYQGVPITDALIARICSWLNMGVEATFSQQQLLHIFPFLEKYKNDHVIEFSLHDQGLVPGEK